MPVPNSNGRSNANSESHGHANGSTNGTAHANGSARGNGTTDLASNGTAPTGSGLGALIAETLTLRDYLHDGYARASRLCVSLRRHRKQSKTVASVLTSLRQLQQIEG